jgi:hypothetical protein
MSKTVCKKVEGTVFCHLFPTICLIAFLAVSLHAELKNTIKLFSKIRPEDLKKTQKQGR